MWQPPSVLQNKIYVSIEFGQTSKQGERASIVMLKPRIRTILGLHAQTLDSTFALAILGLSPCQ